MKYETENKRQAKLKAELKDAQNELQNLVEENNKLKTVFESLMHESRRFSSDIADYSEALLAQIKEKLPSAESAAGIYFTQRVCYLLAWLLPILSLIHKY